MSRTLNVTVWPNPFHGEATVAINTQDHSSPLAMSIFW